MYNNMTLNFAKEYIKEHEGLRLSVYKDSLGFPTIGYGHKLLPGEKYKKITQEQADELFDKDFEKHLQEAKKFPDFDELEGKHQIVIIDLCFNMGGNFYHKFPKFTQYMKDKNFKMAAYELKNSKYYNQTGRRAKNNIRLLTEK